MSTVSKIAGQLSATLKTIASQCIELAERPSDAGLQGALTGQLTECNSLYESLMPLLTQMAPVPGPPSQSAITSALEKLNWPAFTNSLAQSSQGVVECTAQVRSAYEGNPAFRGITLSRLGQAVDQMAGLIAQLRAVL